jgi:hypothetical protein
MCWRVLRDVPDSHMGVRSHCPMLRHSMRALDALEVMGIVSEASDVCGNGSARPARHPGGSGECLSFPSAMCAICVVTGGSWGPMGVLGRAGELTRPARLCNISGAMGGPYHSPGVCAHTRVDVPPRRGRVSYGGGIRGCGNCAGACGCARLAAA